ncbi:MAG: LysR family transcriptional regulator [Rhodospirillaceae bacterium]|nr:LysR family transcriptional regulator [Rhodospirillaceae bacterium]
MDFRALETFLWIARLGGFRLAADRLNTTQPSVSARIRGLEDELGVRLFERNARAVTLTAKGRDLIPYVERILTLKSEMVAQIGDPAVVQGTIILGVVETIAHTWLPLLIECLAQRYPALSLELDVDITANLSRRLTSREIDIAFLMGPVVSPDIENLPLGTHPLIWVGSPRLDVHGRLLGLGDLRRIPVITFPRNSRPHMDLEALFRGGDARPRIHNSSSLATIVRMAVDGIGICAMPMEIVQRELDAGLLLPLDVSVDLPALTFTASFPHAADTALPRAVCDLAYRTAIEHSRERLNP